jgi:hypothetical protein
MSSHLNVGSVSKISKLNLHPNKYIYIYINKRNTLFQEIEIKVKIKRGKNQILMLQQLARG